MSICHYHTFLYISIYMQREILLFINLFHSSLVLWDLENHNKSTNKLLEQEQHLKIVKRVKMQHPSETRSAHHAAQDLASRIRKGDSAASTTQVSSISFWYPPTDASVRLFLARYEIIRMIPILVKHLKEKLEATSTCVYKYTYLAKVSVIKQFS